MAIATSGERISTKGAGRQVPETQVPETRSPKTIPSNEGNLTGVAGTGQLTLSYRLLPFSGRSLVGSLPQNTLGFGQQD
jgi:hypothetical protein